MGLDKLRVEIDEIDKELRRLLEKRMDISNQVGEYKRENDIPIFHPEREKEIIEKKVSKIEKEEYKQAYKDIIHKIMETSRRIQGNMIYSKSEKDSILDFNAYLDANTSLEGNTEIVVGYQGIPGSYSEEALSQIYGNDYDSVQNYPTFEKAVAALKKGEITELVLPIENSSTGGVKDVDHLISAMNLFITKEAYLPINHVLVGIDGAKLEEIEMVYSHPQAISQCSRFLTDKNLIAQPYYNTAMSAKKIVDSKDRKVAAIASMRAANIYKLQVLAENIGDNGTNYTRFVVVKSEFMKDEKANKIGIRLNLAHEVGSLYRIINIIAESDLNMTRIESRPIYGRPWEYYFFIDFEGNVMEKRIRDAITRIIDYCSEFNFLGNYQKGYWDFG